MGLPAFSLIKIFSSFLFARNDTNTPFKISLLSVILNILISVIFFKQIGFIIIPIATTISSWFNGIALMMIVINRSYFKFINTFFEKLWRIIFSNIISLGLFYFLVINFKNYLSYENEYKFLWIIFLVLLTFIVYIFVSINLKAFKISEIKAKY